MSNDYPVLTIVVISSVPGVVVDVVSVVWDGSGAVAGQAWRVEVFGVERGGKFNVGR